MGSSEREPRTRDTHVRLPPALAAQLQAIAESEVRSMNNLIVLALTEWLASRRPRPPR